MQPIAVEGQTDENIAPHMGRHAVFKCVLHERDEDHRGDRGIGTLIAFLDRKMDMRAVVHAVFLQLDILADVVDLGPEGNLILFGVGVHVFGQVHELHERRLGP